MDIHETVDELLGCHAGWKIALLGHLEDLFLLLTLLDEHVVAALSLRASIPALDILLKLLLVDNILICNDVCSGSIFVKRTQTLACIFLLFVASSIFPR